MSPYKLLGITRDASLLDIKRAYVRLLKLHRPDEDPVAFQRVHAAFEQCMAKRRQHEAKLLAREARGLAAGPTIDELETNDEVEGEEHESEADTDADADTDTDTDTDTNTDTDTDTDTGTGTGHDASPIHYSPFPVVDDVLDAARIQSPEEFQAWLRADQRLYGLGFKREVADILIARLSAGVGETLTWQALDAIFRFFEVDSISDPHLRRDPSALFLWQRAQGDQRFSRKLQAIRSRPHGDFADRTVAAEMFGEADWRRSAIIFFIPTLSVQLRNEFTALQALDPIRAESAVAPAVIEYWMPITDPARLDWRRIARAWTQAVVYPLAIAPLVMLATGVTWTTRLSWWGIAALVLGLGWTAWTLLRWARLRFFTWRYARYGTGEAPAGASFFADAPTAVVTATIALSLVVSALEVIFGGEGAAMLQAYLLVIGAISVVRAGGRFRWESGLCMLAWTAALEPGLGSLIRTQADFPLVVLGPVAVALAIELSMVVDFFHARILDIAIYDIRQRVSFVQLGMVALAVLGLCLRNS